MSVNSGRLWTEIVAEHERVIAGLRDAGRTIESISDVIIEAFRAGKRLYIIGNGGSAADAQHIAGELLGRFRINRPALPAIALTTDTSTLTAVANDFAFDQVFVRQVEGLVRAGDVLWCLSTSGNSPNVLAAAKLARERGAVVLGFTGQSGGEFGPICHYLFRAPHDRSDRIQEAHQLAYHAICERVEAALAQ
ncbi:MAG: SIS domain-containing protein [Planctomycetes bacterium]|nr:SIS domain-containing protein [Planctomycetota bacterium]